MSEERLIVIIAAIKGMKPEDFTKAGPPNMTALKAVIPDVTAEERDTAWVKIQEDIAASRSEASAVQAPEEEKTVVTGADVIKSLRERGHAI